MDTGYKTTAAIVPRERESTYCVLLTDVGELKNLILKVRGGGIRRCRRHLVEFACDEEEEVRFSHSSSARVNFNLIFIRIRKGEKSAGWKFSKS